MTGRVDRLVGARGSLQRQYALATGLFAVLVLAIIVLFGHFMAGTLSRRYLSDLLISGRDDARRLADDIASETTTEELDVVILRREQLIRDALESFDRREVVESIEVTDLDGRVVYQGDVRSLESLPREVSVGLDLPAGLTADGRIVESQETFQIKVPLGDVGEVVLYLSKARVAERVNRLRRELLVQTAGVAGVTLLTLVVAFAFVWHLVQRTRRLEAATREAEEFAALGALAANLAHEIRNPLNSINLNLELLEEDLQDGGGEAQTSVASTRREVGRLARLVSDFLTYARPATPEIGPVRVDLLLKDVREFLQAEVRSMGVHLRLSPGLPDGAVQSDQAQLRQVLLNLVLNAVQAVAPLEADRRVVELTAEEREEQIMLVVRDRGPGIPPEDLADVRKAFVTRRRGGTGLGLAIAERFVTAHGGRIDLNNLKPHGLEAVVVLPRAPGDGKMTRRPEASDE